MPTTAQNIHSVFFIRCFLRNNNREVKVELFFNWFGGNQNSTFCSIFSNWLDLNFQANLYCFKKLKKYLDFRAKIVKKVSIFGVINTCKGFKNYKTILDTKHHRASQRKNRHVIVFFSWIKKKAFLQQKITIHIKLFKIEKVVFDCCQNFCQSILKGHEIFCTRKSHF